MEKDWKPKVQLWMKEYQIEKVDLNLIYEALTHSSYKGLGYDVKDNERLEFLGDSVLDLIVAHQLFLNSKLSEGNMTEERKNLVRNEILAPLFDKARLKDLTRTANDFEFSIKIKADFIEALFGAVFLDKGYLRCLEFWEIMQDFNDKSLFDTSVNMPSSIKQIENESIIKPSKNAKNALQEYCDKRSLPKPEYSVINKEGLDHKPQFNVEVRVAVLISKKKVMISASATASTKKRAEILCAEKICIQVKIDYTPI